MAEIDIKNKIISTESVIELAQILNNHLTDLQQKSKKAEADNINKPPVERKYETKLSNHKLIFELKFGSSKVQRGDFEWLKENLSKNQSSVSGVLIDYAASYCKNSSGFVLKNEFLKLQLDINRISPAGSLFMNFCSYEESEKVKQQIDLWVKKLPKRMDSFVKNEWIYLKTPSFAISFSVFSVAAVVFLLFLIFSNFIPKSVHDFVVQYWYALSLIAAGGAIVLGFLIPNANSLKLKKSNFKANIKLEEYGTGYGGYKESTEFAVGRFQNNDKLRKQIKRNYVISLIVFILCVLILASLALVVKFVKF